MVLNRYGNISDDGDVADTLGACLQISISRLSAKTRIHKAALGIAGKEEDFFFESCEFLSSLSTWKRLRSPNIY